MTPDNNIALISLIPFRTSASLKDLCILGIQLKMVRKTQAIPLKKLFPAKPIPLLNAATIALPKPAKIVIPNTERSEIIPISVIISGIIPSIPAEIKIPSSVKSNLIIIIIILSSSHNFLSIVTPKRWKMELTYRHKLTKSLYLLKYITISLYFQVYVNFNKIRLQFT
mgnify:CR=1 FL=1